MSTNLTRTLRAARSNDNTYENNAALMHIDTGDQAKLAQTPISSRTRYNPATPFIF